ncbi:helix-turn-helix domain-containing protein [Paenibacillus sp. LMG 31461]|uniref:Helix-turn-helix domain-containing protein n=1 Tax=Paenibacillus plantarum TaxID=2654975 RepID=A0ABX1XLL2_9BACL|nr:AraC family transcriptional regulator [Paenibacillus plantarum]NOU69423.1 helix-turn-helix domain-containing protein [Paenibacillus plantarum]
MNGKLLIATHLLRHYIIGPHRHLVVPIGSYPNWSLMYAEEGSYQFGVGNQSDGEAGPGDIILIPPNMAFRRKSLTPVSAHFFVFKWFDGQGEEIVSLDETDFPYGKVSIRDLNRLSTTCGHLRAVGEVVQGNSNDFANHMLQDMLYLYRQEVTSVQRSLSKDQLIHEAAKHIRNQAHTPISIQQLAASVGLSQSRFTRRFNASLGMLPSEYLTRIRLQIARDLLIDTDKKMEEIAELCGYQNGFYFSRVFTKIMQISPSEYRRTYRF